MARKIQTQDHTAEHRENIRKNLARVEAHLQVAEHHGKQIRAGLIRERDDLQRDIEHHQKLLLAPSAGRWTSEDRADYEKKLARRQQLDEALAEDEQS